MSSYISKTYKLLKNDEDLGFTGLNEADYDDYNCKYRTMIKSYKSSLNLNSYKLDTKGFEEKVKELGEENAQLKISARQASYREGQLIEQLKNAKLEVNTLRNMLKNEYVVHQSKCKNCATYSQKSVDKLIAELDTEKARVMQFKKMYENQMENKKELTDYYEKKLHNILRDKDILIKKYEEKIRIVSTYSPPHSQTMDSSTSIQYQLSSKKSNQEIMTPQTEKSLRKFPPPTPPRASSPRINPPSQKEIPQKEERNLNSLFRPIVQGLKKMHISLDELRCIPQIQRFTQLQSVPKNRYIKLLRDFPFECQDEDLIQESYNWAVEKIQYNGQNFTGLNVFSILLQKMQNI